MIGPHPVCVGVTLIVTKNLFGGILSYIVFQIQRIAANQDPVTPVDYGNVTSAEKSFTTATASI